jgi:hypothetical protein
MGGGSHQPAKDSAASSMRLSAARALRPLDLDVQDMMQGGLERCVLEAQSNALSAGTLGHNDAILTVFRPHCVHVCFAQRRGEDEEGRGGAETLRLAAETPRTAAGWECSLAPTPTPQQAKPFISSVTCSVSQGRRQSVPGQAAECARAVGRVSQGRRQSVRGQARHGMCSCSPHSPLPASLNPSAHEWDERGVRVDPVGAIAGESMVGRERRGGEGNWRDLEGKHAGRNKVGFSVPQSPVHHRHEQKADEAEDWSHLPAQHHRPHHAQVHLCAQACASEMRS